MNVIKIWIFASRPKTLIASISPVLIGTTIAYSLGHFHFYTFLASFLFALFIQIGTNLTNDYADDLKGADTAMRKGPLRITQAELVNKKMMRVAIIITFLMAALSSIYLIVIGGWPIAILSMLAISCGILYTAGPYALAYLGLGDLFVHLFFGPIAAAGVTYLQTLIISKEAFLAGLAPGMLATAILVVNNLRDYEEDSLANKKTLIVRYGLPFGKREYLFLITLSAHIPLLLFMLTKKHPFTLLAALSLPFSIPLIQTVFSFSDPRKLNPILTKTGQLLALYTLLFIVGYLL